MAWKLYKEGGKKDGAEGEGGNVDWMRKSNEKGSGARISYRI